ncbi:ACT domain-containing protein [Egibacter rhizosphaerae]|uniref:ACT domain-containing protein n=1 Tax=Egibacter rhizosphaerae TaxID=1670831 RepID=A0A411YJ30_9ACTN|nr:ACT domain-containing protein [Egibacter rhizosphaerae]QBI21129.1 ACT domain-containing protein [Egibacter rhizosphaerae]
MTPGQLDDLVRGLPRRYLLVAPSEQVATHARLLAAGPPAVDLRAGPVDGTTAVSVVAEDRRGLMADVAGTLLAHGFVVLEARAFTRGDGVALDWFVGDGSSVDEAALDELPATLRHAVAGEIDVATLLDRADGEVTGLARPARTPVEVTFDRGPTLTRVEVRGADAPGLLFRLGRVLAEERLDVVGARVATMGPEVRDVFFVRPSGGPIDTGRVASRLREAAGDPREA